MHLLSLTSHWKRKAAAVYHHHDWWTGHGSAHLNLLISSSNICVYGKWGTRTTRTSLWEVTAMSKELMGIMGYVITLEDMNKMLHTQRSQFCQDMKAVKAMQKLGAGTDVYAPKLWCSPSDTSWWPLVAPYFSFISWQPYFFFFLVFTQQSHNAPDLLNCYCVIIHLPFL